MKKWISVTLLALLCAGPVYAADCGKDHQDHYEAGVADGRNDGSSGQPENPTRHREKDKKHKNSWNCYKHGYEIGYGNASADRKRNSGANQGSSEGMGGMPRQGSNERAYYDDGCQRGRQDG